MENLWREDYVPTTADITRRIDDPLLTNVDWASVKSNLYAACCKNPNKNN